MKKIISYLAILAFAILPLRAQDSTIASALLYRYAGVPSAGTSEIDTLTVQSGTSAGTFTISIANGRTTSAITWSATDATLIARIDAALEALSEIGTGGCVVAAGSGSSGIGTYTITMGGKNAVRDFPALSIGTNSLTGGSAPTLATTTAGVEATWRTAPTGTVIINSSTGLVYSNTSTTANSPTWTAIVGISVAASADLRGMLSDETGTGVAVFATTPILVTPVLGVATGTSLAVTTGGLTSAGPTGAGIGYATGAGGAVSQATDRTTGVTLNKLTGAITTQATSLAAQTSVAFTVTNSTVAIGDTVILSIRSGPTGTKTIATVTTVAAGSFQINLFNTDASTADTGAAIINFAVIKAVGS